MTISKREKTRERLLIAAQQLLLEGGVSALTVNKLSASAELALGTFYNYYRTREEVVEDICALLLSAYQRDIDAATAGLEDPAQIVAASSLQTLSMLDSGSALGRLLFETELPIERVIHAVRLRFIRDARAGLASGVFKVANEAVMLSMISGATYAALHDRYTGELPADSLLTVTENILVLLGVAPPQAPGLARQSYALQPPRKLPLLATELLAPLSAKAASTLPALETP